MVRSLRRLHPRELGWEQTFLLLTAVLSSTIVLKFGQVQYLELLYALQLLLLLRTFARNRFRAEVLLSMLVLGSLYAVFLVFGLFFAWLTSSTQDFYMPPGVSALHLPVVIAVLRAMELFASAAILLYLVHIFADSAEKLRLVLRVYFWTGVASALFSLLTLPLQHLGVGQFGTYTWEFRWRGFFNEGGPYGLYLVSVFLALMALRGLHWENRRWLTLAFPLLALAFVESKSKAAFFALFLLLAINTLLLQSGKRRWITLAVFVGVVGSLTVMIDLEGFLRLYQRSTTNYERLSRLHTHDINYVQGRVAGAFIVPRMLEAHPILGVGWGNYGLVRNAPEYRGASAWADFADEPSLGLFGQAAELGLPLSALLLTCLCFPVVYLRRLRAPGYVLNLALLQPIVHLFGAQLNVTYPWVVTAMALGLGLLARRRRSVLVREPLAQVSLPRSSEPLGAH